MKTRYVAGALLAGAIAEILTMAYLFQEPDHKFLTQTPTLDVELLDTPAPIILTGCFRPLIRGPHTPVAPCAAPPAPEAPADPVAAPTPPYAAPIVSYTALPEPVLTPVLTPPAAPAYVPPVVTHTGGGFFDRAPPCYRTETQCPR
jgi:hypothetical protein